jgi:hypothetical protein
MEVVGLLSHHDSWWCWYWGCWECLKCLGWLRRGYLVVFVVVFVCVHYVTRVILRVVRLPIIIVDLSMVVALIVKY